MRLLRVRLENYIGIYNGMGLITIDINFSLCVHPIAVIKGDNGTGKSTLYKALSPLPDPTIEFIEGRKASKKIVYGLDDGTILTIEYTSNVRANGERMPIKAYIERYYPSTNTSISLNPSENITSGKEVIYSFFNLDDNFLMLSQLSASRKGLGSLKPYDRKRYVNSIISQLSDFITMNKLFTKKSMVLKSIVNQCTTKLQQIGNIEQVKSELQKSTQDLESIKQDLHKSTEALAVLKNQINTFEDSNIMREIYSIKDSLEKIDKYNNCPVDDVEKGVKIYTDALDTHEKDKVLYTNDLHNSRQRMQSLVEEEEDIRNKLTEVDTKLNSLLDKETEEQYKTKIVILDEEIQRLTFSYESMKNKYGFTYEATQTELETAKGIINEINEKLIEIANKPYFDSELVAQAINIDKDRLSLDLTNLHLTVGNLSSSISQLNAELNLLQKYKERLNLVPKECTLAYKCGLLNWGDCEYTTNPDIEILEKEKRIKELEEMHKHAIDSVQKASVLFNLNNDYSIVLNLLSSNSLLKKIFNYEDYQILRSITNNNKIEFNIDQYEQFQNIYVSIEACKKDKQVLTEEWLRFGNSVEYSVWSTKKSMLEESLNSILENKKKCSSFIDLYTTKLNDLEIKIAEVSEKKKFYEEILPVFKSKKEMQSKLFNLEQELHNYEENKNIYEGMQFSYNRSKSEAEALEKNIEALKYKLTLYSQYERDYIQYQDLYCKLENVRKYSSVNGIQTVYMEVFMNSILTVANKLLANLFKGEFTLEPFVINDKEFRIPCIDIEGNLREDISLMSDSQLSMISMIISFALLNKASESYNIIKLDEVDNNLDNYNRVQFAKLIEQLMVQLNFHQCILISHNNELDLTNTDIILFRCEDKEQLAYLENSGANIIFNINK